MIKNSPESLTFLRGFYRLLVLIIIIFMSIIIVHGHIFKQIFVSSVVLAGYYKLRQGHKKEGVLDIKCVSFSLLFSPFIMPSILSAFLRHEKLHRRGTTPEVNVSLESASSRAAAGKFFFQSKHNVRNSRCL